MGMENVKSNFIPPFSALTLSWGKVVKKAVAIDGKIIVRPMVRVVITVDHRFGDASNLKTFLPILKEYFEDPMNFNKEKWVYKKKVV